MTLFDRYLIRRFLGAFTVLYVSTFGLFVVIDGFTNMDEFHRDSQTAMQTMRRMAEYYVYQSSFFLELVGPILCIVTVMVVFALLQKNSEIAPILAAGIPTYRLAIPFVAATLVVSGLLAMNQEMIIPQIAEQLQAPRKVSEEHGQKVEPIYDQNRIHIDGRQLFLESNRLVDAKFVLPAPELTKELTTVRGDEAVYLPPAGDRPGGWFMSNPSPAFDRLPLTAQGQQLVLRSRKPAGIFICTSAASDQLYNRSRGFKMLSTRELLRRIRHPSTSMVSTNAQLIHLHARMTRPLLCVVAVLVVIPLIVRRDSRSLIGSMAICTGVLGTLYSLNMLSEYLGSANLMPPDLAAWGPIIFSGTVGAWLTQYAQS